jgi:hypothetical protein
VPIGIRRELLARHCTEAGQIEKAVELWGKAGQRSLARSALVEAAEQLTRALDQIATLVPGFRCAQSGLLNWSFQGGPHTHRSVADIPANWRCPDDLDIPSSLRAAFGHKNLGVYLVVREGGRLGVGDSVLAPRSEPIWSRFIFYEVGPGSHYIAERPAPMDQIWVRADIRAGRTDEKPSTNETLTNTAADHQPMRGQALSSLNGP